MAEVEQLLEQVGLPYAYRRFRPFKEKPLPDPPYIVWYIDEEHSFGSDLENLLKRRKITIELYSKNKDKKNESKLESLLKFVAFDKWEDYIENEKLYFVSYEFEIITKIGG